MRKSKVIFIKNALILTVTGLVIRFLGLIFRVWMASAVGAEGMGLYSQVFSFYMLASAFASTGINTAVTRLVSEELALGRTGGIKIILKRCLAVTLFIATVSVLVIFFGADFIANNIIGDTRAAPSLKTLTISLPFMGISSCLKGYFIARKKASPASSSGILEQLARIALIFLLVSKTAGKGIALSCRAVVLGDCLAEVLSCGFMYISYNVDKRRHFKTDNYNKLGYSVLKKLFHIAAPITSGRYLNSLLRTIENIIVPKNLEKSGMTSSDALSVFGVIKGMALPLIFFPATFLNAMSTLLIPEMSEAAVSGRNLKVKYTAEKSIHITLIAAFPLSVIFFYASAPLGLLFYKDSTSGEIIRLLAPIIPLMYMDSVCDGLLKGLDQQFSLFRNSLIDSLARIVLILVFLKRYGIYGFIGIMYLSNAFTCIMNFFRLKRISKANIPWFSWVILPALFALLIGTTVYLILDTLTLNNLIFSVVFTLLTCILYVFAVVKTKCITREDLR
ncbi:MAG: polysaccharide biosynthesis protein [Clostridia bacterium]|nr:polysaccharide biosynthesis protein [Clostridia bacterium]